MKTLMAVALTAVLAMAASAQNPPSPPSQADRVQHHIQHLAVMLSLTPAQQQQATTLLTNVMNAQEASQPSMKAAHDALQTAVKNNDANAIQQAANTIGQLTAQSIANHAKAMATFYQTLTPDQQTKFQQIMAEGFGMHDGMMGMHGMHSMHGPPPQE